MLTGVVLLWTLEMELAVNLVTVFSKAIISELFLYHTVYGEWNKTVCVSDPPLGLESTLCEKTMDSVPELNLRSAFISITAYCVWSWNYYRTISPPWAGVKPQGWSWAPQSAWTPCPGRAPLLRSWASRGSSATCLPQSHSGLVLPQGAPGVCPPSGGDSLFGLCIQ